ncbi:uncharacterized protein [Aristolochia californica]|uniref:uncharacterized protein n=1 Tax=Aristolochia californica TaxID=171875 RepID=UPI0035E3A08B
MLRQASGRNQRSKSLNVKHVVQICLLLAVCFWLLYQVKHSHDKKKAFDENNAKFSEDLQHKQEILKFGRKDLNERGGVTSEIEKHHVKEENEEEDENKHEETEDEGREDEGRGGGDDEIDEHDQEKFNEESERQEEFGDEEKDVEEFKEKEEEENSEKQENEEEEENKENEQGEENKEIAENEDNEERKANSHEAREAQYNGDDASSAVVKESVNLEGEKMDLRTSKDEQIDNPEKDSAEVAKINARIGFSFDQNESNANSVIQTIEKRDNPERDAVDSDNAVIVTVVSSVDQNGSNTSSIVEKVEKPAENGTDTKERVGEIGSSHMGNGTLTNPTLEIEVDNLTISNSNLEKEENGGETKLLSQGNDTLSHLPTESTGQILVENLGNETRIVGSDQHQTMTLGTETTTDLEDPNRRSVLLGQTNSTQGEGEGQIENTNTPTETGTGLNENPTDARGESESEKNPISSILDENSDAVLVETTDTNSSVVTQEVKEALTDLGTLPETGMEGNAENVAAE